MCAQRGIAVPHEKVRHRLCLSKRVIDLPRSVEATMGCIDSIYPLDRFSHGVLLAVAVAVAMWCVQHFVAQKVSVSAIFACDDTFKCPHDRTLEQIGDGRGRRGATAAKHPAFCDGKKGSLGNIHPRRIV